VQDCGSISHFTERSKEENGKTGNASNEPLHDGMPESLDRCRYLEAMHPGPWIKGRSRGNLPLRK
jgi:hypothetical protein